MAGGQGIQIKFDKNKALTDVQTIISECKGKLENADLNANIKFDSKELTAFIDQMTKLNEVFSKIDFSKFNQIGEQISKTTSAVANSGEIIVKNADKIKGALKTYDEVISDLKKNGDVNILNEKVNPNNDNIDKFTAKVKTATGEIQKLQYVLREAQKITEDGSVSNVKSYELVSKDIINGQQIKQLEDYKNKLIEIRNVLKESTDISLGTKDSKTLDSKINQLAQYVSRLEDGLKVKNLNIDEIGSYVDKVTNKFNNLVEVNDKNIRQQKELLDFESKLDSTVEKLQEKLSKNTSKSNDLFNADIEKQSKEIYDEIENRLQKILDLKKKMVSASESNKIALQEELNIQEKYLNEANAKLNSNPSFKNTARDENITRINEEGMQRVNAQIDAHNKKLEESTGHVRTWGSAFKNALDNIILYSTSGGLLYGLFDQIREGVTFMKDLDTAQSNIMMITGKSREEVQGLTKDYSELATQYHETTDNMMNGAEEFLRAGYTNNETESLLKSSTLASKISGTDQKTVSDDLIAIKNAYNMEVDGINGVSGAVDKMTKLDNESATSFRELAEAMKHSSASAQGVGLTFDQASAQIATVSSITRRSASTIGEAFKTIYSRFEAVKGGKTFDPDNEPVNNVERDMNKIGIAIRKNSGEFKDFNIVLEELHGKWDKLNDVQRNAIVGSLAGTRQREQLLTLMNNWNTYETLLGKEKDSAGNAQKIFDEGFGTSTQAKINDLKNAMQKFWMTLIDSGVVNKFISAITTLITGITEFAKSTNSSIVTIALLGTAIGGVIKLFTSFLSSFTLLKTAMSGMRTAEEIAKVGSAVAVTGESVGVFGGLLTKLPLLFNPVTLGIIGTTLAVWGLVKAFENLKQPNIKPIQPLTSTEDVKNTQKQKESNPYLYAKADVPISLPQNANGKPLVVSVDTKKAMDAYNQLEQQSKTKLLSIKANSTTITQQLANETDRIYEQMGNQIKTEYDKQYKDNTSALNSFITNSKSLTSQEKQDMLNKEATYYNQKKETINNGLNQISQILNTASANHRSLTDEEYAQINKIQLTFLGEQVSAVSKNQIEQEAIYQNLKDNTTTLTTEQASNVIKASADQRDKTIKEAEEQYLQVKAQAEYQRDVTGQLSADQAKKIIDEAGKQKDEAIANARQQHQQVVIEVQNQMGDISTTIDANSGKIFSAWDRIKNYFENNIIHPKVEVNTTGLGVDSKSGMGTVTDTHTHTADDKNTHGATGGAYALGGTAKKGKNLTGEDGKEIVVSKDGKQYKVVGTYGAEIVDMEGGETVIPHNETERILSKNNGSNGSAYADGTDWYPNGTKIQTTEVGGTIEGEGFFPNLFGDKPTKSSSSSSSKKSSSSSSSSSSSKKTYNEAHFNFQSTVDVDKTELDSDIRDIDNLTKAITNLDKLTKVYKDSKNFDEALKTNGMSIDNLNQKLNSLKIGYQNTLNTKSRIGNELMTEFTGLFKGKDLDAMTKPEMETLYNQAYGVEKTGITDSEKTALQNQSKALKQLIDDWFGAKDQLDSISQQELDTQTSITEAIKEKWDIVFATKDAEITGFDKQIDTLKHQMNTLNDFDYSGKISIEQQISDLDINRLSTLQSITSELQAQLDSGTLTANEWDIVNDKVTTYKNTIADAEQSIRQTYNEMKSTVSSLESSIESLASQISSAYKEMYQQQEKALVDPLNDEIKAIQKQITDLQNGEEDKVKQRDALQQQYNDVLNDNSIYGKAKQQELTDKLKSLNKEIQIANLEDKEKEKQQKLTDIEQEFSTLMDDSNLYKQASQMILQGDTKKISNFLATNLPEFQRKQTLFGDQWINVFNEETTKNLDQLKNIGTLLTTLKDEQSKLNTFFTGTTTTTTTSGGLAKQNVWVTGTGTADYTSAQAYADKLGWTIKVINGTNYNQVQSGDRLVGYAGTLYGSKTSGTMVTGADRTATQALVNNDVTNLLNQLAKSTTTSNSSGNTFIDSVANAVASKVSSTGAVVNTPVVTSSSSSGSTSSYTSNGVTHSVTENGSTTGLHTTYSSTSTNSNGAKVTGINYGTGGVTTYSFSDGTSKTVKAYDTGGETGDWSDNDGKLAFLHKKERVLSSEQTNAFNDLVYKIMPNFQNSPLAQFNTPNLGEFLKTTFNLNQPLVKNEITNNNYTPFDTESSMNNLERMLKRQIGNKLGYIG